MKLKEAKLGIDKNNPESFSKHLSYVLDLVDNIQRITEAKESIIKEITTVINNRNQYTRFDNFNLSYDAMAI